MTEHAQPSQSTDDASAQVLPTAGPSAILGSVGGACRRCGTSYTVGSVNRCPHCKSFVLANQERRSDGTRARYQPHELREDVDRFIAGVIADRGGEAALTTLQRAYISRLGDVELTHRLLCMDINQHGLKTESGAKYRDVLDKFYAGVDRFDRLAQRIGVDRVARNISGLSAADYVKAVQS